MIKAIILDWAGTTVDYGCFAPVGAFIKAFAAFDLYPAVEEIRAPMGMQKKAHIAKMLEGKPHTQEDIDKIYDRFEPALFDVLAKYTDLLPGLPAAIARIREMGIAIGSTTGYTRAMMDVVVPLAKEKGYSPDCVVCPDEVGGMGRPAPYMLWRNLEKLGVTSIHEVLKIGDTVADIDEGKNAGCLCVGVLKGSSMLGLSEEELSAISRPEAHVLLKAATEVYKTAGADYVIDDITFLPELVKYLNKEVKRYV